LSPFALAADGLLLLHALFVFFVVSGLPIIILGGICGWPWVRNPWFRVTHIAAIAYVTVQSWFGQICPLTHWEMALRRRAGQEAYDRTFIGYWLDYLLYYDAPPWLFALVYTGFCAAVISCWILLPPRFRSAR
jgi:hypothetical protein